MTSQSKELRPERLLELSQEVSRIANSLARLSTMPAPASPVEPEDTGPLPEVSVHSVRAVLRARRLRKRYFEEELFADPAWDMLLDLFQAELAQQRVAVSSLCSASAVPATTALRWIRTMVEKGLFVRQDDQFDGRRVYVELSPAASRALRRYFAEIEKIRTRLNQSDDVERQLVTIAEDYGLKP